MMKNLLPVLLLLCAMAFRSAAQESNKPPAAISLSGSLSDTINFTNTGYASVVLINAADSVLKAFTRSDGNGHFSLAVDTPARYLLLVSHPSFAGYVEEVNIGRGLVQLEPVYLTSKKQMLNEIVITDAKAIVIKGDTIEYKADSFQTRAFDNVDELIKKLPGIEIGKDGKIKAFGQEVKKMTVDGEEFFSDDPAVVSKTLRASSVDKVQVFDKKSDQAAFTGVDDGERIKTINLQLKDNARRGYFGKAQLGAGAPGYWENMAMINAFKGKRKIAGYGIMSNTNTNGLGWSDESKFGSSKVTVVNDDGSSYSMVQSDDDDWDGTYSGTGLPRAWTGGALYNNKWRNDSLTLTSGYRFRKKMNETVENTTSQYILPDTQYYTTQQSSARNILVGHIGNLSTEYWIDTASSLKLTVQGGYKDVQSLVREQSESKNTAGALINNNNASRQTDNDDKNLDADLFYKRKFRKKGRSFSADLKGNWKESGSKGIYRSDYTLFSSGSSYSLNQRKDNSGSEKSGQLMLSYTEPLSDKWNLQFNYSYSQRHNEAINNTYDLQGGGDNGGGVFNPLYSSHFVVDFRQNKGGAGLKYNTKKVNFSVGSDLSGIQVRQDDRQYDTTYRYNYFNVLPKASFTLRQSQASTLNIYYNTRIAQPALTQLQPLRNNTDPLNIMTGNPDLRQSYRHSLGGFFNTYKVLSSRGCYVSAEFAMVQHAISLNQHIDDNGRAINQYVNVNGNYNANAWAGYSRKIGEVQAGANLQAEYNHDNNFINSLANVNNRTTLSPSLEANYSKDTTWDIRYSVGPSYNYNKSSVRQDVTTAYWQLRQAFDFNISLPGKFRFGTGMTLDLRQKLNPAEQHNNVFLWNLSLSRFFLKDRSLEAKAYVNDLLNQNAGYSRFNTATYVSEKNYNTIRRYVLFSLVWNFTKAGAGQATPAITD